MSLLEYGYFISLLHLVVSFLVWLLAIKIILSEFTYVRLFVLLFITFSITYGLLDFIGVSIILLLLWSTT